MLKFILGKVNRIHDAEDILQDVFLKIFRKIDQLQDQAAVKSWIYRITRNTIIDFYKKRKDIALSPEAFHDIEDELVDESNMDDEIASCLRNMVFDLPEKYKTVYDLYENRNMKHKEIAEELDISLSASKVRLLRAKEHFKKNLVECCDFELDKYGNVLDYEHKGERGGCNDEINEGNCQSCD